MFYGIMVLSILRMARSTAKCEHGHSTNSEKEHSVSIQSTHVSAASVQSTFIYCPAKALTRRGTRKAVDENDVHALGGLGLVLANLLSRATRKG